MGPALVLKTLAERTVRSDVAKMNSNVAAICDVFLRNDTVCAIELG